jgi:hypothetical protein
MQCMAHLYVMYISSMTWCAFPPCVTSMQFAYALRYVTVLPLCDCDVITSVWSLVLSVLLSDGLAAGDVVRAHHLLQLLPQLLLQVCNHNVSLS